MARAPFRYQQLADAIREQIETGLYLPGDKLPSVRKLHEQLNLSVSTIHQAYLKLETLGLVEARPRSGFYVGPVSPDRFMAPDFRKFRSVPTEIHMDAMVNSVVTAMNNPRLIPMGSSSISTELLPYKQLAKYTRQLTIKEMKSLIAYGLADGIPELRRQVTMRFLGMIPDIGPEDVIITAGCTEAVALALQVVARPGDVIAIESPTHFGFLQLLKQMGFRVVEIPADPIHGLDPDEVVSVIEQVSVKACLLIPNFQNPMGSLMPDANKQKLVDILTRHNIPIIEDDICGELYFGKHRPVPLKTFDKKDLVITCASFSKTLAPGLRVGWMLPGNRFRDRISQLKAGTTVSCAGLNQYIVAQFLSGNAFDRHLRTLREKLQQQISRMALAIHKFFPPDIRMAIPKGGPLLWVELPSRVDSVSVYQQGLANHVAILPGIACSPSGRFSNFIRIGCGYPFNAKMEEGIQILGKIIQTQAME